MTVLEEQRVTRSTGAVQLRGITKRFGDGPNVLEDVTLDVAEGDAKKLTDMLAERGIGQVTLGGGATYGDVPVAEPNYVDTKVEQPALPPTEVFDPAAPPPSNLSDCVM